MMLGFEYHHPWGHEAMWSILSSVQATLRSLDEAKSLYAHNHRMVWVQRGLKVHPVPIPFCEQHCHAPDQAAHGPIQPS